MSCRSGPCPRTNKQSRAWPAPTIQSKTTSPVVDRQLVTFLVLPRKVTKRNRPRFAAASRYPALIDWSGGCGTRATRSNITSDLAGVVCQLSRMASCFISARRHPLTSLRYSAAHRGKGRYAKSASQNTSRCLPAVFSWCNCRVSICKSLGIKE
jgi:hypothetical protein